MKIEVTSPLLVRFPEGEIHLVPGTPAELPAHRVAKLLAKAPGKVKPLGLDPGVTITWDSPLFGLLSGECLGINQKGFVDVYHPLSETIVSIPLAWVTIP